MDAGGCRHAVGAGVAYGLIAAVSWVVAPPARLSAFDPAAVLGMGMVMTVAIAAVLVHRRRPAVLVPGLVVLICVCLLLDAGFLTVLLLFELLFAGTLFARGRWRITAWVFAGLVNIAIVLPAWGPGGVDSLGAVLILQNITLSVVAVWWAQGLRLLHERSERERARAIAQELAAMRARELTEAQSELAVTAERVRLARDIHDLVAGRLAAISMQAALAGDELAAGAPVDAHVDAIRQCSDATLREVRDMITDLSSEGAEDLVGTPRRHFAETVEVARGLGVDLQVQDELRVVDDTAAAALYVVAQEAVVNMLLHAAPCTGRVRLARGPDQVCLDATNTCSPTRDDGPERRRAEGSGHGLRNMARRLAPLGGVVLHGSPDQGATWVVTATVPMTHGTQRRM